MATDPTPTRPHHLPRHEVHCHGTPAALCGTCLRALAPGDPRWQAYFAEPPLHPGGTTCAQHLPARQCHAAATTAPTTTPQGTPR